MKTGEQVNLEENGQFSNEVRNKIYVVGSNHHIYMKEQPKEY